MDCNELIEQLGEYLDTDEKTDLCRAIEQHMSVCPDCQVYVDTVKKTIVLYQADRQLIETPATVNSRLESTLAQEYERAARTTRD